MSMLPWSKLGPCQGNHRVFLGQFVNTTQLDCHLFSFSLYSVVEDVFLFFFSWPLASRLYFLTVATCEMGLETFSLLFSAVRMAFKDDSSCVDLRYQIWVKIFLLSMQRRPRVDSAGSVPLVSDLEKHGMGPPCMRVCFQNRKVTVVRDELSCHKWVLWILSSLHATERPLLAVRLPSTFKRFVSFLPVARLLAGLPLFFLLRND